MSDQRNQGSKQKASDSKNDGQKRGGGEPVSLEELASKINGLPSIIAGAKNAVISALTARAMITGGQVFEDEQAAIAEVGKAFDDLIAAVKEKSGQILAAVEKAIRVIESNEQKHLWKRMIIVIVGLLVLAAIVFGVYVFFSSGANAGSASLTKPGTLSAVTSTIAGVNDTDFNKIRGAANSLCLIADWRDPVKAAAQATIYAESAIRAKPKGPGFDAGAVLSELADPKKNPSKCPQ